MSEPENFLSRWSRKKREADAAPEAEKPVAAAAPEAAPAPSAPLVEEPAFDLAKLPSLDQIVADTDMSVFMKPGVPGTLRHAALRRAWTSDPAIRDFRGLQENDWDFNAPDGVPGFGTFKSEEEIKALAQRIFGPDRREEDVVPQSAPQDSGDATVAETRRAEDRMLDKDQDIPARPEEQAAKNDNATASQQDDDVAAQRVTARRHGGALPQ